MEYKLEKFFQVCEINNNLLGFGVLQDALINTNYLFKTYEDASNWIKKIGQTGINYSIIEVIQKKRI